MLETDAASRATEKLHETVAALVSDAADVQWLERHLRPLLGLEGSDQLGSDRRSEAFAAWRRFFEALAEQRPLVLVFEDLHFADAGLLDFVDYLADWATGVPILIVATARPELLARRPGWGGGKANSVTLSLAPLSDEETARLVHALVERRVLSAQVHGMLLARSGGNPLYAEEFIRMLAQSRPPDELPETVQALIAGRIDGLTPDEKALLQDGAVLGKVFWLGAAAALSGLERATVAERLHALERKEFLRRERRSAVGDEVEYTFRHLLVRDVAYGQVPRGPRGEKHVLAARWLESLGRSEDHAEMLAHHYLSALELLRAAGRSAEKLVEPARHALRAAGDRALALNAWAAAVRYHAEALELWPVDDPDRAELLFSLARARYLAGELREEALEEARDELLAHGRTERAAEAEALLAELWWHRGDRDRCDRHLDRGSELVRELPASAAHVLSQVARYRMLARDYDSALAIGEEALAMARSLGLQELEAHALTNVATVKSSLGDAGALADLERSAELALAIRSPEAARALNNIGSILILQGHHGRAAASFAEAARMGEELGAMTIARFARANHTTFLHRFGDWDEALRWVEAEIAAADAGAATLAEATCRQVRARIRLARDDVTGALEDVERALALVRDARDPQTLAPTLGTAAYVLAGLGREDEARELASEVLAAPRIDGEVRLIPLAHVAWQLGFGSQVAELLARVRPQTPLTAAGIAQAEGNFDAAADNYRELGILAYEADARLRAAEQLLAKARRVEADEQLRKALEFYRRVGATRFIRRAETLLAATGDETVRLLQ